MNKTYFILIFSRQGTRIRRLGVSRRAICLFLLMGAALLISVGWEFTDNLWMKREIEKGRNLSVQVQTQREQLLTQQKRIKASQQLVAKMKLEREEAENLRAQFKEDIKTLRAQMQVQQEKLLSLKELIKASQQLLANWKGLRKKIRASLPRKSKSSLTGQELLDELETSLASLRGELESLSASIPSEWPAKGRLSSRFGNRRSPWTGKKEFHAGIDIANRRGTPVYAPGDAVVKFAGRNGSSGKTIVLNHGQGITTRYAHLSKIYVKKGDRIRKNQKIANMGNTGKSTNPHLHYVVRVNGIPIDPRRQLLKQMPPSSS